MAFNPMSRPPETQHSAMLSGGSTTLSVNDPLELKELSTIELKETTTNALATLPSAV